MNDRELADKVVKLLGWSPLILETYPPKVFLERWDTAGALMEKWQTVQTWHMPYEGEPTWFCATDVDFAGEPTGIVSNESLRRAIIEACVGALDV